jgi:hypothetical protein
MVSSEILEACSGLSPRIGHMVTVRFLFLALLFLKKWKIEEGLFNSFTKRGGYIPYIPFFLPKVLEVVGTLGENI